MTIYVNAGGALVSADGGAAEACLAGGGRLATPAEVRMWEGGAERVAAAGKTASAPAPKQVVNSLPADVVPQPRQVTPPTLPLPPPAVPRRHDPDAPPPDAAPGPEDPPKAARPGRRRPRRP